jgi:hypothetical protein
MGAPFWTEEEKNYFLKEILPRSVYASGRLSLDAGRTFEDLVSLFILFLPLFNEASWRLEGVLRAITALLPFSRLLRQL